MSRFFPPRSLVWVGLTLALVRIAMGVLWVTNVRWKLPPTFRCEPGEGRGLCYWMEEMVEHSMFPPQAWAVENIALEYYQVFGYLVVGMEALTGILLIFGLFTRFAGLLGLVQSFNLFLGLSLAPEEWIWSYIMMMFLHLVVMVLAAGRYFGADAYLHERWKAKRAAGDDSRAVQIGAMST